MTTCPACAGKGYHPADDEHPTTDCDECNGSGEVADVLPTTRTADVVAVDADLDAEVF